MITSEEGQRFMHHYEGLRLEAYPDPATGGAPWTIGYGDTGPDVVLGLVITKQNADERFARRLAKEFEPGVNKVLTVIVDQSQFDAMISLAYNIGLANFKSSTLLKLVNQKKKVEAAEQFLRWDKGDGKRMLGLARRRASEMSLFLGNDVDSAIAWGERIKA
jgi:lysozyme